MYTCCVPTAAYSALSVFWQPLPRRERVAARLEPGVAQRLLAGVAEHEVHEQLGRVGAGRAGGDPDAARDQRREVLGVLPAHELALGGA